MSEYILTAEAVHYQYEDGTRALNGIDLCVRRGERLAVMGANGSGKSTFFLCLNGVLRPNAGTLFFDDEPYQYSQKACFPCGAGWVSCFRIPTTSFSAPTYTGRFLSARSISACRRMRRAAAWNMCCRN